MHLVGHKDTGKKRAKVCWEVRQLQLIAEHKRKASDCAVETSSEFGKGKQPEIDHFQAHFLFF